MESQSSTSSSQYVSNHETTSKMSLGVKVVHLSSMFPDSSDKQIKDAIQVHPDNLQECIDIPLLPEPK